MNEHTAINGALMRIIIFRNCSEFCKVIHLLKFLCIFQATTVLAIRKHYKGLGILQTHKHNSFLKYFITISQCSERTTIYEPIQPASRFNTVNCTRMKLKLCNCRGRLTPKDDRATESLPQIQHTHHLQVMS